MQNALYGKHISLKISKDNIFEDISGLEKLWRSRNSNYFRNEQKQKLNKFYPEKIEFEKFILLLKKIQKDDNQKKNRIFNFF